jgi:CBS domain-containing protein
MKARDVMVSRVITVKPSSSIKEVANIFLERRISAAPVVDDQGKLIGIISEGDLMHRAEAGTERHRSWWLRLLTAEETLAAEYVKAHARKVADVMTSDVITTGPETPLKRVPIVQNGQLIGIVSRANLIQAMASARKGPEIPLSDAAIRDRLLAGLKAQEWLDTFLLNVTVNGGVVDLWGITRSDADRKAIRVAAESTPGVSAVNDNLFTRRLQW